MKRNHAIKNLNSLLYIGLFMISLWGSCTSDSGGNKKDSAIDTLPETLQKLNQAILSDPNNAENYYLRSKYYFAQKKQYEALEDIYKAIALKPENPLYHFMGGEYLFSIGKTRKCADAMLEVVKIQPDYTEAWQKLSELYIIGNDFDSAMWCFKQLDRLDPNNPKNIFFKGELFKLVKADTAKALILFQKATEIDPSYWQAWLQLGIIFNAKNDPLCVQYFNNVLKVNKNSVEAYFGRGDFLRKIGKYAAAEADLKFVVQLDPGHYLACYNLGIIYTKVGKIQSAIDQFTATIERKEDYAYAWYSRGLCYYETGDIAAAKSDLKKCLALDQVNFKSAEVLLQKLGN